MNAWDRFGDRGFDGVAGRIRAAMGGDREDDLKARRRMGRDAYERAMAARGMPRGTARIWASAHPLFAELGDD